MIRCPLFLQAAIPKADFRAWMKTARFSVVTRFARWLERDLDVIHREVVLPLVLADFVDGHDVGVLELRCRLGLGAEAFNIGLTGQLPARIIFTATMRFRLICRALYTTPIPPRAISSSSS